MKVNINGKISDFRSNFDSHNPSNNGWQKQMEDYFKIVQLNGVKVFVKRFKKAKCFFSFALISLKITRSMRCATRIPGKWSGKSSLKMSST